MIPPPPRSTLFPYTTLFRSRHPGRIEDVAIPLLALTQRNLRLPALRDIDHDPAQAGGPASFHHHGHHVSQPYDAAVGGDHAILEIVKALVIDRAGGKRRNPFRIIRVEVFGPDGRIGQPTFHWIAEHTLCLLADKREAQR